MKFQRDLCIAVLIANLVEAQLHTQRSLKKKAAPMGAEKAAPKKVEAKKGLEKKGEDGNFRKNRYMTETAKKSVLIKDEAASISAVAKEMAASKETAAKEKAASKEAAVAKEKAASKESAVPKEKAAAETKKVGDTKKFETKKVETKGKVGDSRKNRYI
jgi:hypothetical protein